MKKTTIMRIASTLLIAVLLTTCAIGATFARYATKATGGDEARVAKWDVKVVEKGQETFAFDLFETINSTDGDLEENVDTGLIAPGTQGSFAIALTADNEVTTAYKVDYAVTNDNNIPIKFSVDGGSTWTDDLTDVTGTINANTAEAFNQEITVQWKWDFGGVDENGTGTDNTYGTGTYTVAVDVTVTFDQVD